MSAKPLFPSDATFVLPPKPQYYAMGLTGRLEIQPHDNVHDNVGGLMSNIPVAAMDPIFYVHHCQIDRLWATWQAATGSVYNWGTTATDPSEQDWGGRKFSFVGEGNKLVTVTAAGQLSTKRLGYEYATLPSARPSMAGVAAAAARPPAVAVAAAQASGLSVGSEGARATLAPSPTPSPQAVSPQVTTLVLKEVKLISRPPAPLHVFLNLPEGTAPTLDSSHYVGTLNFFNWDTKTGGPMLDMPGHGGSGHAMPGTGEFRFAVGDLLARQKADNLWTGGPVSVTITTLGADRSRGRTYVTIGQVQLLP